MKQRRNHDDDDTGEYWRDVRSYRQDKRAANRRSSTRLLRDAGFVIEEKNAGAHLVVRHGDDVVDFWPGTGLWIDRATPGERRRGVFSLVDHLKRKAPKQ